jgi:Arc/MetJ family transcription regulator
MRTTVALDDKLLAKAQQFTGLQERSALLQEALKALIARESARRAQRFAAAECRLKAIRRRRSRS